MLKVDHVKQTRMADENSLLEDIVYFEGRLEEMGFNGDCAYERAMAQTFERLVEERRNSLKKLRQTNDAA